MDAAYHDSRFTAEISKRMQVSNKQTENGGKEGTKITIHNLINI